MLARLPDCGARRRLPPARPAARPPSPGPVTWVLPGVGGGGGRGVREDAGVTLRAAPRHEAAAPVLGRGHGPGRRGGNLEEGAWNQSIRGGQGHRRGGWRGRLFKKENQKGRGEGRSEGTAPSRPQGAETIAGRPQPGASRRARLALLFIRVYSHSSVYIPGKKKKVEPGNKNFFLSVFIACLGQGVVSRNFWGHSLPHPTPHPPGEKGKKGKSLLLQLL